MVQNSSRYDRCLRYLIRSNRNAGPVMAKRLLVLETGTASFTSLPATTSVTGQLVGQIKHKHARGPSLGYP